METRYHQLFRHSVTTGKCEDCGLIDNHSNACHDAAPIRKIEELYDRIEKLDLENKNLRDALAKIGMASLAASTLGFLRRKIEEAVEPVLPALLQKEKDGNPWTPNQDYAGKPVKSGPTPGPWKDDSLLFSGGWRCIVNLPGGRSIDVADPRNRKTDEEDKANAELIASAPDLARKVNEARELLEESIRYAGLDPTAEEAEHIHAWEKKAREFLGNR